MATIKDVLCFLNDLDFIDKENDHGFSENLGLVKKRLVNEFEDYKVFKLIYALNLVDEKIILITITDLDSSLERTDFLRVFVFLSSF